MADPWNPEQWARFDASLRRETLAAGDAEAWRCVARGALRVMARYSTSFYIVSRFLPAHKRERVEVIYAAVRYPDEVVDTFAIPDTEKVRRLDAWAGEYERALGIPDFRAAIEEGVPPVLAGFVRVVREAGIPPEHYRAFLGAMRMDVAPRPFETLDDLIDTYIYGSAVVVGYFLAHVYGPARPGGLGRALGGARELAIALQLTNFVRDAGEDRRRGRVYLPQDLLQAAGADMDRLDDPASRKRVLAAIRAVAAHAEEAYGRAENAVEDFAPDSRVAIRACIDVYRKLNRRILSSRDCVARRESVSSWRKFRALPSCKYWRLPLYAVRLR
jgi:phytoene synthase